MVPDGGWIYPDLANALMAVQQLDEVRRVIDQAHTRKLEFPSTHDVLYGLAFLKGDSAAMAEQEEWYATQPQYEPFGLALAAETEAYAGHLQKARELTKRAIESALRGGELEQIQCLLGHASVQTTERYLLQAESWASSERSVRPQNGRAAAGKT
jgi:hypothetical protein